MECFKPTRFVNLPWCGDVFDTVVAFFGSWLTVTGAHFWIWPHFSKPDELEASLPLLSGHRRSWCEFSEKKVFPLNFVSMAPERSREWDFNLAIHLGPCDNVFRFRMYGKSPTHLGLEYIMTEGRVIRVATPRCAPVADQSTGDGNWNPRDFNFRFGRQGLND